MISQKTIKILSLALLSAGLLASCSSSSSSKATEEQSADTVRLVEVAPAEMRALNLSEEFTAQLEAFLESNNSGNGSNNSGNGPNNSGNGPNNSGNGPNNSGNATNQDSNPDQPKT